MKNNKLIFSAWFGKQGLTVKYFDVGARGDISTPWSLFSHGEIKVIGFEPDPVECQRLSDAFPERKYYPHALWGSQASRPFYLCEWPATSSMYPPAQNNNAQFQTQHWKGRIPVKTLQTECIALDSIVNAADAPDFIKIDTQGAELEILKGATRLLTDGAPLVLTETWCTEVYEGMPLTHDIMEFMYEMGYQVFDLNIAAAWKHKNSLIADPFCKQKTIGFDLLFVKRLDRIQFKSDGDLLKFAGLCELFGFRDYAMAVLEKFSSESEKFKEALALMTRNDRQERRLTQRIWRTIRKLLGHPVSLWPKLH